MGGTSAGAAQKEQKAQDVTQQTRALQSNILRYVDVQVFRYQYIHQLDCLDKTKSYIL